MTNALDAVTKLNLGCGQFPKAGYINVDIAPETKADVMHDLEVLPYPFEDGQFERVEMSHVLEHLKDPVSVLREVERLLAPGGIVHIQVPHFSRAFTHYDHKHGFDVTFPRYFDPTFCGGYTGVHFELVSQRLVWFAQPWLKKKELSQLSFVLGKSIGKLFDIIGNLNLYLTSRLLCYWFGGYEELEIVFRKPSK